MPPRHAAVIVAEMEGSWGSVRGWDPAFFLNRTMAHSARDLAALRAAGLRVQSWP